jgi:hypothetical protein
MLPFSTLRPFFPDARPKTPVWLRSVKRRLQPTCSCCRIRNRRVIRSAIHVLFARFFDAECWLNVAAGCYRSHSYLQLKEATRLRSIMRKQQQQQARLHGLQQRVMYAWSPEQVIPHFCIDLCGRAKLFCQRVQMLISWSFMKCYGLLTLAA